MSSRPSSRATADGESPTASKTSTAKRPLTKPVAPRLSSSSTATKPTSTSTARTSTSTAGSLNKAPIRPTSSTSAVRRPPSSAATTSSTFHRTRPSTTSVEASGDESKRDGITARPKRMSTASVTGTEKSPTTASRTSTATSVRKPAMSATSTTARPSVRSPTATTKTSTSTTRPTTTTLAARTKVAAATSARPTSNLADKKRLSTIPASPAVKRNVKSVDEDKENEATSAQQKPQVRPALGTRQSTRSILIEQRIQEFEMVNQMLRSAMTADGMDDDEQEKVEQETKDTMARLRSDLAKIRDFEREHGRIPTEVELQEIEDIPEDGQSMVKAESSATTDAEVSKLREELQESRGQVEELKSHLAETKARMEYFGKSVEEESEKVQDATKSIQAEHAAKIEEMLALHKSTIEELESAHQNTIDEVAEKHKAEIQALEETKDKDLSTKEVEIEALRSELNEVKSTEEPVKSNDVDDPPSYADSSELDDLKRQLKATQDRHLAAKDNAKNKIAKVLDDYAKGIAVLKDQHKEKVTELEKQIEEARGGSDDQELLREKEAHADTLQQVQAVRDELSAVKTTKDKDDETHLRSVDDLKKQLAALEKVNAEDADTARIAADKMRTEHEEQLQELRGQLEMARAELKGNAELSKKQDVDAIQKLSDDLKAAEEKLASTISTHEVAKKTLERQLQDATDGASTATAAHEREIDALKDQLNAATKSHESESSEYTIKLESVQSELADKESEMKTLRDSHTDALSKAQSDANAAHQASLEEVKQKHTEELSKLEEQSKSALRDLESLGSANSVNIEQIKSDAANAQKKALDEQTSVHKATVSELEAKLAALQKDLTDLTQSHDEHVNKIKTEHTSEKDAALAALKTEQEQELAIIRSKSTASNDSLEALKTAHAAELQKLESRVKSMHGDLDAAQFQVRSLKEILESMQQESQEKEDEHQKELEKKNDDFSQAVMKLSAQSMRIAELETAHRQAVEQAKTAVQAETQASLDALKQQHDEAFDNLRKQLHEEHAANIHTMRSEHTSAIDLLTKEVDTRDHDIDELKADHARALSDLHASSQQRQSDSIEQLRAEHITTLNDLRASLQSQHDTSIKELQDEYATKADEDSRKFTQSAQQSKAEHENTVAALRADLEQVREKLQDTSAMDTVTAQLSASQQAFSNLQEEQAATISSMSKEHANALNKLQTELEQLQAEAKKPVDTTEVDNVKSELAESKAKIAELTNSHAEAVGSKDIQHADAIRALQSELDEAKAAASSAAQSSDEAQEVKGLLADAKQTISELSEQYAVATMEAETQRLAAEKAKQELTDLKKTLSEATAAAESSTPDTKPANGSANNTKPSPKPGLKASKWATEETEVPEDDSPASATNNAQEGLGLRDSSITAKEPQKPRQRNVAGQMAGIQEQIRQLTEMNEEFLEDNQKWARDLSRVEDDGTVTMSEFADEKDQLDDK